MKTLLIIGVSMFGAHHVQVHKYWWIATETCYVSTATNRDGSFRATPYIVCGPFTKSGWHNKPQQIAD